MAITVKAAARTSRRMGLGEYSGTCVARKRLHGLLFTENRFPAGRVIPAHIHAYPHVTLMLDGGMEERYDGCHLVCPTGSLLVVPANLEHRDVVGRNGAHTLSIELSRSLVSRISKESGLLRAPRVLLDGCLRVHFRNVCQSFWAASAGEGFALECLTLQLLLAAVRLSVPSDGDGTRPPWLTTVLRHIEANLCTKLSLQGLAELAGIHEAHLARTFKRHTGRTIGEYANEIRLREAERRLLEGELLAHIAAETGFADQAHFSRRFKDAYGCTPSTFRKLSTPVQNATHVQGYL